MKINPFLSTILLSKIITILFLSKELNIFSIIEVGVFQFGLNQNPSFWQVLITIVHIPFALLAHHHTIVSYLTK